MSDKAESVVENVEKEERQNRAGSRPLGRAVLAGVILLGLAVVVSIVGAVQYIEGERARMLRVWEVQLGIVADSRAAVVDDWLSSKLGALRSLAENGFLQLYMTEIELGVGSGQDQPVAETGYLANLLLDTAEREGFIATDTSARVPANVSRTGRAGIALLDSEGQLLVATPDMPPLTEPIERALDEARQGRAAFIDLHEGPGGDPTLGYVVPVYAVQGEQTGSSGIGYVVGLRPVGAAFFDLLEQPGETRRTAESYLVRKSGATVEYLSPLRDGTHALDRRLGDDPASLAAAFAIETPGGFARLRNYAGDEVLATGRALSRAPWYVVRTISTEEALEETDRRLSTALTIMVLAILTAAALIVAVWRHGTSLRARELAEKYRHLAEALERRGAFLKVVTDSQPTAIAVTDSERRITFANRNAAALAGIGQEDMVGKSLAAAFGSESARLYESGQRQAIEKGGAVSLAHVLEEGDKERVVRADYVPFRDSGEDQPLMLIVLQDMTELVEQRSRYERTLKGLVSTLVGLVDRRDRFSAFQSARVAEVATAIAEEMELPEDVVRTADIASNLVNLGKILVPSDLLMKTGELTEKEREIIADSMDATVDLLEGVEFDTPVAATLSALRERWDGQGSPNGLKGEDIPAAARVVAVANAFVGMVSPRAYRDAIPIDRACEILLEEAGKRFDRRPVTALINVIENRGGREDWKHFADPPPSSLPSPGDFTSG